MQAAINRQSVDLSAYPDLVMIMLGFQVRGWRGLLVMRRIGRGLAQITRNRPDGLLADEGMMFGLTHIGFRQYWRDLDALERFTRSEPHADWWRRTSEMSAGAGFWHEILASHLATDEPRQAEHAGIRHIKCCGLVVGKNDLDPRLPVSWVHDGFSRRY